MAALTPIRKMVLVAVSAAAALIGAGSAMAAPSSASLAGDPSGARVERSSVRHVLGMSDPSDSSYYYYYAQEL
ncbi:hypothetical protein ACFWBN_34785 [Streptomyces sp. NPDC059989]|uniref:hypothetical protein n=1 Tax=Streptomyces sp. NPDC059989 TaxID=3347026 RepID=UPI0036C6321F